MEIFLDPDQNSICGGAAPSSYSAPLSRSPLLPLLSLAPFGRGWAGLGVGLIVGGFSNTSIDTNLCKGRCDPWRVV